MKGLFYLVATLLVVTVFLPDVGSAAESLLLRLLELANEALSAVHT